MNFCTADVQSSFNSLGKEWEVFPFSVKKKPADSLMKLYDASMVAFSKHHFVSVSFIWKSLC